MKYIICRCGKELELKRKGSKIQATCIKCNRIYTTWEDDIKKN